MNENTQAQHTPGPWMAYNAINGKTLKHWRIKGDAVRNDPTFATIDSSGKILPEFEAANARLIAAAPDLLAALEALVNGAYISANKDKFCPFTVEELASANAAIAKAREAQS